MKIGVWTSDSLQPEEGGAFSYLTRLVHTLDAHSFDPALELVFISTERSTTGLRKPIIHLEPVQSNVSAKKRWALRIARWFGMEQVFAKQLREERQLLQEQQWTRTLRSHGVELIYYPRQSLVAIRDFPYVATNWDLGHQSMYAFPEVNTHAIFQDRDAFYREQLRRALCVFAESEAGKEELVHYLRINPDRIRVVPLFAGDVVRQEVSDERQTALLDQLNLKPGRFFYYPAQFWAHKNHYALIEAFKVIQQTRPDIRLVFSGSDKGNEAYVRELTQGLENVLFLGFAALETVHTLYRHAAALVMPTYLGPTNMPVLEALDLACPVICSDLAGHREQLQDAAVYCDPSDHDALRAGMEAMLDPEIREQWQEKIRDRQAEANFGPERSVRAIAGHLTELMNIRKTWK